MNLQLGSVCEGILWSDSRPVDEEREGEDGGSQTDRESKSEREPERKKGGVDSTFSKLSQTALGGSAA